MHIDTTLARASEAFRLARLPFITRRGALLALMLLLPLTMTGAEKSIFDGVRKVVLLGDSITYAGGYVETVEAYFVSQNPKREVEFLNLGLPSETVSGLSEPGHAGGKFPRPDLHERLARVLEKTKPDLVIACYGMNCGIYHPFSEERFAKYQEGMRRLRERCAAAGAKVLHVTPPVFDPVPIQEKTLPAGLAVYEKPYGGYNDVLDKYSEWLVAQRKAGWDVVDAHVPIAKHLGEQRKADANYRLANDGVHLNATGHWLIAQQILLHAGAKAATTATNATQLLSSQPHGTQILDLVRQRQVILKDAWLTECRHLRPGMKQGLPITEANAKAAEITARIRALQQKAP